MKKLLAATVGALLCMSASLPAHAADPKVDAQALIKQTESQYAGESTHSRMHMKIVTRSYTREMSLESWGQGRDKFLAKVLSPKKDAGTATLKIGNEMWNYLPKIDRLMKVPSSLLGDRWMGSHMTNDDLVKDRKIDELYEFKAEAGPGDTVLITAIPKNDAPVVWGKIVYQIDVVRRIPLRIRYYEEDRSLVRVIDFEEVRQVNGRWLPMRMRVQPMDPPGEYTEFEYETIDLDAKLDPNLFSLRSLRK